MQTETIEKLNAIIEVATQINEEDIQNLLNARKRIEEKAGENPTEQDKVGLTRIDSILAICSTLEKDNG